MQAATLLIRLYAAPPYDKKCINCIQGLNFSKVLPGKSIKDRGTKEQRIEAVEIQGLNLFPIKFLIRLHTCKSLVGHFFLIHYMYVCKLMYTCIRMQIQMMKPLCGKKECG